MEVATITFSRNFFKQNFSFLDLFSVNILNFALSLAMTLLVLPTFPHAIYLLYFSYMTLHQWKPVKSQILKRKMASTKEWDFVCEEMLGKPSTLEAFFNAINVWVERPQVINRRLTGSSVLQSFSTGSTSEFSSKIFQLAQDEIITKNQLIGLSESCSSEVENFHNNTITEVIIREIFPRETNKHKMLEVIVEGIEKKV